MEVAPDPRFIASIRAVNVVVGGTQTINVDGQRIEVPSRDDLLAYAAAVQHAYDRWADRADAGEEGTPLYAQSSNMERGPDIFLETRALPMRLAQHRPQSTDGSEPSVELLEAVQGAPRTIILGEPGAGKTAALERLAWVTATETLANAPDAPLTVPIVARLADYRGEADLTSLLRRALNRHNTWQLGDSSVRVLLWAQNVRFVLLLDGLNELERAHMGDGRKAVRLHLDDYPTHVVHLTCRTADFDAEAEANPEMSVLPDAQVWTVQELTDAIRHWDDEQGESDVRDYLRMHLGEGQGQRLWEHLHNDERLTDLARIPLFLWMFKEAAGDGRGDLPSDRGGLLRRFVRAPRLLGRVPKAERVAAERSLECVGWRMQADGVLVTHGAAIDRALKEARGERTYDLDGMRTYLATSGLLIDQGEDRCKLLHQLIQEYAAAAHLLHEDPTGEKLPRLAQESWWRETCIAALWLNEKLHEPDYLFALMHDAAVDLRVRVAAADVLAEVGDPRFVRKAVASGVEAIEPEMVPIPAGEAVLGGEDPEAYDDEKPECRVWVRAFDLAIYPVTNAEFACFVDAGGYDDPSLWPVGGQAWLRGEGKLDAETEQDLRNYYQTFSRDVEAWIARSKQREALDDAVADNLRWWARNGTEDSYIEAYARQILGEQRRQPYYWEDRRFNRSNQPVVGVNWYEAMAYAAWLSSVTGRVYRLPTEAEWEWAAKRNTRRYPWGNDWDEDACNWQGSKLNRPNPVGVYRQGATEDGLQELAGNVYEWTLSLYRPYPYVPEDGREATDVEGLRVMKGGSWYVARDRVRCARRDRSNTWNRNNVNGFRLARTSL